MAPARVVPPFAARSFFSSPRSCGGNRKCLSFLEGSENRFSDRDLLFIPFAIVSTCGGWAFPFLCNMITEPLPRLFFGNGSSLFFFLSASVSCNLAGSPIGLHFVLLGSRGQIFCRFMQGFELIGAFPFHILFDAYVAPGGRVRRRYNLRLFPPQRLRERPNAAVVPSPPLEPPRCSVLTAARCGSPFSELDSRFRLFLRCFMREGFFPAFLIAPDKVLFF